MIEEEKEKEKLEEFNFSKKKSAVLNFKRDPFRKKYEFLSKKVEIKEKEIKEIKEPRERKKKKDKYEKEITFPNELDNLSKSIFI